MQKIKKNSSNFLGRKTVNRPYANVPTLYYHGRKKELVEAGTQPSYFTQSFIESNKEVERRMRERKDAVLPYKVWKFSVIGGIVFGMFTMSLVYRYLGPSAYAEDQQSRKEAREESMTTEVEEETPEEVMKVLKRQVLQNEKKTIILNTPPSEFSYIESVLDTALLYEIDQKQDFERKVRELVSGYPIEEMVPEILKQDKVTAAFLISIAKKESNWGRRVPVLNGQDCFNYWGYRGIRRLMGTGGHTCFNSRKDAVETVAKRISNLANQEELNTPEKMIVWKCGWNCKGHSTSGVKKWISDVELYFEKFNELAEKE